jgi:hypothetical protein
MIEDSTLISCIRNPFDLLTSYYFHSRGANHKGWANCLNIHNINSFESFIEKYCDPNFDWHFPKLKQNLFSQLYDNEGKMIFDIIFRYENLMNDVDTFTEQYGFNHNRTKPLNKSTGKNKNFRDYYSPKMVDIVNEKCANELKTFNYKYEK